MPNAKKAYVSDGINWLPLVSGVPDLTGYATTEYVDEFTPSITLSSNPPASPEEGELWFDNDTNELFMYDSVYWIEISGAPTDFSEYLTQSSASTIYQEKVENVDNTEIGYLDGVTSGIQSQFNSKLNLSTASTLYLTISNPVISGVTSINAIEESVTLAATSASGMVVYDVLTNNAITYYTSNASANWTLNIRGNSETTLNSMLNTGQSLTLAFAVTNGETAYRQTDLQIDGSSVTPKWQGGASPTTGNVNSIDIYSITVVKTGNAAFTVWESQTRFA
jgi:hypothetical protein